MMELPQVLLKVLKRWPFRLLPNLQQASVAQFLEVAPLPILR
jgi:hypothetical protein